MLLLTNFQYIITKKKQIVTKALEIPKPAISFEKIYNDNHKVFDEFILDFNKTLVSEQNFNDNFNKLKEKYNNVKFPDYFLNISKAKIEKELNKTEYIDFFYNMTVFRIYNEHIKRGEKSYGTVLSFVDYLMEKTDRIKKDADLKLYQKILLIEQIGYILNKMTKDSFLKSDINYLIMSKKEENSILDLVEKFFKDYINNLSEDSKIFFRLLELDSDIGYFNGKQFHCFDMMSIDEIKAHLKEIFIDILITHKANKRISSSKIKKTGIVAINLSEILGSQKFFLEKKLEENQITQGKDVAAKIVVYILYEIYGHKKFLYEYSQNEIYYELPYGKIGDYYLNEIIDKTNEYGDLLDEINLWTDDLDSLNEYFKYKYIIQCKNIPLNNFPSNIKEKIQFFKEQVLKNGINVESFYKKDTKHENEYLNKKRKGPKNIYFNEDEDSVESKEENTAFYFDAMSYDELADLYYNGKIKGDNLAECYRRISKYEIQSKIIL